MNVSAAQYFGLNWPVIRLSDVMLMFAEAGLEADRQTGSAGGGAGAGDGGPEGAEGGLFRVGRAGCHHRGDAAQCRFGHRGCRYGQRELVADPRADDGAGGCGHRRFRNFELTQMRLAGGEGRCLYPEEWGVPAYDELIFVANPERMDAGVILRFLGAVERGTHYIVNHPDEAYAIFAATSADLGDELNRQAWADTLPRFAHSPAGLDHGRYARFETFLLEAGMIDTALPVSRLAVDPGAMR